MCASDEGTATKTSGANVLSSRKKKLRKTLWGGGDVPPPPQLTVRLNCTSEGYYNLRYISECAIPTFCSFVIIIKYNLLQYLFHAIRYPSDVILYFIT